MEAYMQKNEMIYLITEWQNRILKTEGVERVYEADFLGSMGSKPIKVITGFRRSGKSFLIQRIAKKMISNQQDREGQTPFSMLPIENILYLNFEDYALVQINTPKKLGQIFTFFKTEIAKNGRKLVIFDEIQKVENWEQFVRTIYEKYDDIEIILTGSNSQLLSSEISGKLAGRFIETQILPFDFHEYLRYHDIQIRSETDFYRYRDDIEAGFGKYSRFGGLPEIFSIGTDHARNSYLQGIVSKVILDDIITRFNIKNGVIVEKLLNYLLLAIGCNLSFSKITSHLRNLGFSTKTETLIRYVQYIMKTFAIYEVCKFDWKLNRVFSTVRKYYSVDMGLTNFLGGPQRNYSRQLENMVYLKLRQQNLPIYFGELATGKEIDFIIEKQDKEFIKIQITQTLHDDNRRRELSPFTIGDPYIKKGSNYLLSLDEEEGEIEYKGVKIIRKNIVKWLLEI
jgi:predicted AAA+ superfamily ATPase